jgi:hypothetical protein
MCPLTNINFFMALPSVVSQPRIVLDLCVMETNCRLYIVDVKCLQLNLLKDLASKQLPEMTSVNFNVFVTESLVFDTVLS